MDVPVRKLTEKGIHSVKLPVCLPHELLPWLQNHGLFPPVEKKDLEQWWKHASTLDLPHAAISPNCQHHPWWIWGDDCQFNELGEKLICICMGHCLDNRTYSMESRYPIFVLREDPCLINLGCLASACKSL